jgi:hypothetical protein
VRASKCAGHSVGCRFSSMNREVKSGAMSRLLVLVMLVVSLVCSASEEWKEKVLYSFQNGSDGATPAGGVVFDKEGNLYGARPRPGNIAKNKTTLLVLSVPITASKWRASGTLSFSRMTSKPSLYLPTTNTSPLFIV